MARRLGEYLIEQGVLSPRQLQEALRSQRIFGGSLGTHLVELGLLAEDALVDALASIHSVRAAYRTEVLSAPPEVVALLSPDFAKRHRAIPFRVDGDDLHLAIQNPADSLAVHEAAFLTGFNVVPFVTLERVLRDALLGFHRLEPTKSRPAIDTAPQVLPQRAEPTRSSTDEEPRAQQRANTPWSLRDVAQRLAEATHRDEILDLLVSEVARFFPRAAVFAIKADEAVLHRSHGLSIGEGRVVSVSLSDSSVLSFAKQSAEIHYGPVAATPANQDFYTLLGGRAPKAALVLPVLVKGRLVCVLYGDDLDEASPAPDFHRLRKAVALASLALEILILRGKILRDV